MAHEWPALSLREANVSLIDCDHRTPPASDFGYPYVAIPQLRNGHIDLSNVRRITREHFVEWTKKASPTANDVVLSRRCNPGETAVVPAQLEFALGQNLVLLRADGTKVYPPFLRWLVRGPVWWEQVDKFLNVGAVFDSLRCADVPNFRLPIPPLIEQRAIACVLGALDDKIELNRRMNETLEAMARAIFKSWFVDFDPVRAKAEGRPPPSLSPDLAALFPDALDEDGKPARWRIASISEFADLNPESWTRGNAPSFIAYVDLANTKWGCVEDVQRLLWEHAPSRAQRVLRSGDTIVGTVRPGNGSYALIFEEGLTGSTGFAVLRPRASAFRELVYLAATARENIDRLSHLADGAAYPAVRPDTVSSTEVAMPGNGIVSHFSERTAGLLDRMGANNAECQTLATLRDLLLPKLMSGEIRVRDAEKIVSAKL